MPSTHLSLHYHVVFSTKNREPWLTDSVIDRVHEYIGGTVRGLNGVAHAVGGLLAHPPGRRALDDANRWLRSLWLAPPPANFW